VLKRSIVGWESAKNYHQVFWAQWTTENSRWKANKDVIVVVKVMDNKSSKANSQIILVKVHQRPVENWRSNKIKVSSKEVKSQSTFD